MMFHSSSAGLAAKDRLALKSHFRMLALCSALGSAVLLSACGGGDNDGGKVTESTASTVTTPSVVDKYPKVSTPAVSKLTIGEISSDRNYPFSAVDFDLSPFGFVQEEFLVDGKASTYDIAMTSNTAAVDMPVGVDAKVVSSNNPYRTRMVVIRPTDPAKFNGTVIYDWLNASSGYDGNIHWFHQKEMILRKGYAYVGITVQDNSVSSATGLKKWSPTRYGTLDVTNGGAITNDGLSFDIFSQGAKAVRAVPAVMGTLSVKKVIAAGGSQSAFRVGVHMNNVNPIVGNVFDGALLAYGGPKMRTDLTAPVIKVLTETELDFAPGILNEPPILQADTEKLHTWLVTGAAHADLHGFLPRVAIYLRDLNILYGGEQCQTPSRSRVNARYVYNSAIDKIEKYLDKGTTIPSSPAVEFVDKTTPMVKRDSDGFMVGGIRLPDITVPVGVSKGTNTDLFPAACFSTGGFAPFDKTKLDSLYPTHDDYVSKVTTAANKSVADGFMLAEDAQETIETAKASIYGLKLNCGTLCADAGIPPWSVSIQVLRRHTATYPVLNRAQLLAPLDEAAIRIARGYNVTDTTVARMYFNQAVALLQQYISLINASGQSGILLPATATYLSGEANSLIAQLQNL